MKRLLLAPLLLTLLVASCSTNSGEWLTYKEIIWGNKNDDDCREAKILQINKNSIKKSSEGIIYNHREYFSKEVPDSRTNLSSCARTSKVFDNPQHSWELEGKIYYSRILTDCSKKTHWVESPDSPGKERRYKYENGKWYTWGSYYPRPERFSIAPQSSAMIVSGWRSLNKYEGEEGELSSLLKTVCKNR